MIHPDFEYTAYIVYIIRTFYKTFRISKKIEKKWTELIYFSIFQVMVLKTPTEILALYLFVIIVCWKYFKRLVGLELLVKSSYPLSIVAQIWSYDFTVEYWKQIYDILTYFRITLIYADLAKSEKQHAFSCLQCASV